MRVIVSGSSGLIGTAVCRYFRERGDSVRRLVRDESRRAVGPDDIAWSPDEGQIDTAWLEGADVVVHLAGENIAGRWSEAKKQRIMASRRAGTATLCRALAALKQKPPLLLSASAIGYYGDRGEEALTETSTPGSGFLAEVCQFWEQATEPARQAGIRVIHMRFGVVLSRQGGALKLMLTPFKLGVGGRIGSGRQWMSWIHLEDVIGAMQHCIDTRSLRGPVNFTAPQPVTNAEFTRALARALHRPALLPMPAFAARLAFGEMADQGPLASARVFPAVLHNSGYRFKRGDLASALHAELTKNHR